MRCEISIHRLRVQRPLEYQDIEHATSSRTNDERPPESTYGFEQRATFIPFRHGQIPFRLSLALLAKCAVSFSIRNRRRQGRRLSLYRSNPKIRYRQLKPQRSPKSGSHPDRYDWHVETTPNASYLRFLGAKRHRREQKLFFLKHLKGGKGPAASLDGIPGPFLLSASEGKTQLEA